MASSGRQVERNPITKSLTGIVRGIEGAHMMRDGALALLSDAGLRFSPGGDNVTLGQLLKEGVYPGFPKTFC